MTIFDGRCLTDSRARELHLYLLTQKPALNEAWRNHSANPHKQAEAQQLSYILEAIDLCNMHELSPADYALIASLSSLQDI